MFYKGTKIYGTKADQKSSNYIIAKP